MLRFAFLLAVTTAVGGWAYYTFFYTGRRRRLPGGHRFGEDCITMMYAEVRPDPHDRATWYQVPINKKIPATAGER